MQKGNKCPEYFPMGDQAIVAQFEQVISEAVSQKIQSFSRVIKQKKLPGVTDLLPAYNNLTICYDATIVKYDELLTELKCLEKRISKNTEKESRTIHIPVAFGGTHGQDVEEIAKTVDLSPKEVIQLLHSRSYYVYMIGFIAGYPYCGNIDEKLRLKRRTNPRVKVKKGTVQIADKQIGIITMDSPSGWHQVGWTPMEVFNPHHLPPGLLKAGDNVKYVPVSSGFIESWDADQQKEWNREWNM